MLFHARNEFGKFISNVADSVPVAGFGDEVIPAQNSYGDWVELLAGNELTDDAYEIDLNLNSVGSAGEARDCLITIGIDPSGGTDYQDFIPHLVASNASIYLAGGNNGGGGVGYRFPLHVPAGSSIAAKASVSHATVRSAFVALALACRPSHPEHVAAGSYVRAFGVDTDNSRGTLVTPGATVEGSWTELGGPLTETLWYWEWGVGISDAAMNNYAAHVDLGFGSASAKKIAILNGWYGTTASEMIDRPRGQGRMAFAYPGDRIYGRIHHGTTADTNTSLIAYGVGGCP